MAENKNSKKQPLKQKLFPISLSLIAIILDQITKSLVVKYIPLYYEDGTTIPVLGNFLRLIHVRNKAVAFSMGSSLPADARSVMFKIIPLIVIALVYIIYFRNNEFTKLQRWSICGILGGGLGNLIDRFFKPDGVVDFIDNAFFGELWPNAPWIFGWKRWPTYNIADSFVVVCGILFIISFIVIAVRQKKAEKSEK